MKTKQILLLLILPIIWGAYYIASQQSVAGLSTFTVGVLVRFICFVLLTIMMLMRGELALLFNTKHILPRLLLIGLLGFLLDITAFIGLSMSTSSSGVALLKCDIIFVNLISLFLYKERFTKVDWACTLFMLVGVLMVMGVDIRHFSLGNKGNIFFILSALFVSINAFVIKSVQTDSRNPAKDNVVAFYNNFITMFFFTISSLVMGTFGEMNQLRNHPGLVVAVICAGVGQTLIYIVYYYNLRRCAVWIVKVFLLLMPIVSAIISFFLFKEVMLRMQYIGMAIVLLGAFGILLEQHKKTKHCM